MSGCPQRLRSISSQLTADVFRQLTEELRVCFRDADEIEFILLALGEAAVGIAPGPDLGLYQIGKGRDAQSQAEGFAHFCASGEIGVTRVLGELDAKLAAGAERVERVRMVFDCE